MPLSGKGRPKVGVVRCTCIIPFSVFFSGGGGINTKSFMIISPKKTFTSQARREFQWERRKKDVQYNIANLRQRRRNVTACWAPAIALYQHSNTRYSEQVFTKVIFVICRNLHDVQSSCMLASQRTTTCPYRRHHFVSVSLMSCGHFALVYILLPVPFAYQNRAGVRA